MLFDIRESLQAALAKHHDSRLALIETKRFLERKRLELIDITRTVSVTVRALSIMFELAEACSSILVASFPQLMLWGPHMRCTMTRDLCYAKLSPPQNSHTLRR